MPVPWSAFWPGARSKGSELRQVTPGLAGRFLQELLGADPTKNLALAALRHFFDVLVTRHAVALNPFSSVRGKKHSVVDGKTPELATGQARALLSFLDLSHVVGLRDRAVLGVLTYIGERVGVLARLRRGDLQEQETQRVLRFPGKGRQAARNSRALRSGRVDLRLPWKPLISTYPKRPRRCFWRADRWEGWGSSIEP